MLDLAEIKKFYPENLRKFERQILREYWQCQILSIIYDRLSGRDLVFLGGTALRIVYGNQRFSEDLDFDNRGLDFDNFQALSAEIKKKLEQEGLTVEIKTVARGAFRCYLKISQLLFKEGLLPLSREQLTIQIDASPQNYHFVPEITTLDKFDVYTKIKVAPASLILAQKIYCLFNRQRRMGRDFFDVSFLIKNQGVKPDFNYLTEKMGISSAKQLVLKLKEGLAEVDFNQLAAETEPLLIDPSHRARITQFYSDVVESWPES